jgi:hypothetical protein
MLFQSHFRSRYYNAMFKVGATELSAAFFLPEQPHAESEQPHPEREGAAAAHRQSKMPIPHQLRRQ